MTSKDGAVWPRQRLRLFPVKFAKAEIVENYLSKKFAVGHPVIFSSGRAALFIVLKTFYKGDLVRLFPYASQCVVNSVLRANLIPVTPLDFSILDISYNQWGRFNTTTKKPPFIEDSIDSLYPNGAKILRSGADFEVWSLAKILGLNFGAVMWCRDENQANILKEVRDKGKNTKLSIIRFFLSIIKGLNPKLSRMWERLEFRNLPLLSIEYGVISKTVARWDEIYNSRLRGFESVLSDLSLQKLNTQIESENVIPVVIDLPSGFEFSYDKSVKRLHRIFDNGEIKRINVIAYQEYL